MKFTGAAIHRCPLPAHALSARYASDGYADCYVTRVPQAVAHAQFVEAFYTTWLFKLERAILRWLVRMPSTDLEARELAHGNRNVFAAWKVEARAPDQLLMCDFRGATRSWLMVESASADAGGGTHLYFGSVVVPVRTSNGKKAMSFGFRALLGFHKLYSRALLRAARARLTRA